jgi:hypothetical protein
MTQGSNVFVVIPPPERGLSEYRAVVYDMALLGRHTSIKALFQYGFDSLYEAGLDAQEFTAYVDQITCDVFEEFSVQSSYSTIYEMMQQCIEMAFFDVKDFVVYNDLTNIAVNVISVEDYGTMVEVCYGAR